MNWYFITGIMTVLTAISGVCVAVFDNFSPMICAVLGMITGICWLMHTQFSGKKDKTSA